MSKSSRRELFLEKKIANMIQRVLLTEATKKLNDLKSFREIEYKNTNLYDLVEETLKKVSENPKGLDDPKSAGRIFIDVLWGCMTEMLLQFEKSFKKSGSKDAIEVSEEKKKGGIGDYFTFLFSTFLETGKVKTKARVEERYVENHIEKICKCIMFLESQRSVVNKYVISEDESYDEVTFKEYIAEYLNQASRKNAKDFYRTLEYKFNKVLDVFEAPTKEGAKDVTDVVRYKDRIVNRETFYPFGKDAIIDGFKIVLPTSTRSSIFWSRTNWLGEEIVLPEQNDISWCTARYDTNNMFEGYFKDKGINLFYILPKGDKEGLKKMCLGIQKKGGRKTGIGYPDGYEKMSQDDRDVFMWQDEKDHPENFEYSLFVGGHTVVGFENRAFIPDDSPLSDSRVRNKIISKFNLNEDILKRLEEVMADKNPENNVDYVNNLSLGEFKSITNFNTIAPLDPVTGERSKIGLENIQKQISNVINVYKSKIFAVKGYKPNKNIVEYINDNYVDWVEDENLTLPPWQSANSSGYHKKKNNPDYYAIKKIQEKLLGLNYNSRKDFDNGYENLLKTAENREDLFITFEKLKKQVPQNINSENLLIYAFFIRAIQCSNEMKSNSFLNRHKDKLNGIKKINKELNPRNPKNYNDLVEALQKTKREDFLDKKSNTINEENVFNFIKKMEDFIDNYNLSKHEYILKTNKLKPFPERYEIKKDANFTLGDYTEKIQHDPAQHLYVGLHFNVTDFIYIRDNMYTLFEECFFKCFNIKINELNSFNAIKKKNDPVANISFDARFLLDEERRKIINDHFRNLNNPSASEHDWHSDPYRIMKKEELKFRKSFDFFQGMIYDQFKGKHADTMNFLKDENEKGQLGEFNKKKILDLLNLNPMFIFIILKDFQTRFVKGSFEWMLKNLNQNDKEEYVKFSKKINNPYNQEFNNFLIIKGQFSKSDYDYIVMIIKIVLSYTSNNGNNKLLNDLLFCKNNNKKVEFLKIIKHNKLSKESLNALNLHHLGFFNIIDNLNDFYNVIVDTFENVPITKIVIDECKKCFFNNVDILSKITKYFKASIQDIIEKAKNKKDYNLDENDVSKYFDFFKDLFSEYINKGDFMKNEGYLKNYIIDIENKFKKYSDELKDGKIKIEQIPSDLNLHESMYRAKNNMIILSERKLRKIIISNL